MRRAERVAWADPTVLILGSLAGGPKHGYAVIQDVAEQAGVRLGPGTLYGALSRLEAERLVVALPGEGRRRPYQITGEGVALLATRLRAMASFAQIGLARLAAGPA